jgi:ABC-2 type transport system ATP-binding protein
MVGFKDNLAIQTLGLTKYFRDFWGHKSVVAVDSLDLEVHRHEVYGLLGPNGSGKSTTIKLLLGLLFPSRGRSRVLGSVPGDVKTNARIGYLPEESHLYPFLSARETLDFYGRLFGLNRTERKRRIDSLLNMVGLTGAGGRLVGQYSKGMQRRIGLAQALINDPELLILDEPTSGLDPIGTRQIKDLICELGQRGKTVLLCSHLLADVEDVCDRIGILYGGKMQAEGNVEELLERRELTEIRTDRLSDETLEKIKMVIHQEKGDCPVEVQTPRNRLEDYFLEIVAEAQAAAVETSGSIAGSGVSDFLSAAGEVSEGERVLDRLVSGAEKESKSAQAARTETVRPTPVEVREEKIREEVLGSLVEVTPASESSQSDGAPSSRDLTEPVEVEEIGREASSRVDRSLIDRLTQSSSRESRSGSGEEETEETEDEPDSRTEG